MKNEQFATRVIFRTWRDRGGDVIAILLDVEANPRKVSTYERVGQHGESDYEGVMRGTRPATPEEYAPLKKELESIGYRVMVRSRRTWPSTARNQ